MRKFFGWLCLLLGLLLVAGGLVIKLAILPALAVWPDDVDSTRTYDGTLVTMLNAQALATGDMANLFWENVPVSVDRHVTTEQVDGRKALVREVATMYALNADGTRGDVVQGSEDWYTIDRKTLAHIPNFTDNTMVREERQGLVVGFPIGTKQQDYQGWTDDYQALSTTVYQGVEEHEGITTYHFTSSSGPKPIVDAAMLEMFPESMPKAVVASLAPQLGVSDELMAQFTMLLPVLPDPIPFTYLYDYATEYWVEPTTGMLIDYTKDESRILALQVDPSVVAIGMVPVGEVFHLIYEQSDQSIADARDEAEDNKGMINFFGAIIPYAAIGAGALLVLLGGGLLAVRRREK